MADQVLQDIKDRLNIVDVMSGYLQLRKSGTNYKAVCPFHNEKTPSLMISPQKQIWHCFGCGEGGDIFGFVMKMENLEFRETLKILADKAGVRLPEYKATDARAEEESERLLRINNFAARFYHELLLKDKRASGARVYLERRGLLPKTVSEWQIGFAPEEFHALEQALLQKKVGLADLVKAGVSAKNERGQIYDRFRGRITFPIFNHLGDVVGFSARILDSAAQAAKYINSPETPIYNKSKVLFGLNFAKNEIRKKDEAIIVEGQMDCISSHQAGYKNVVASSGTALTEYQLAALGRLTKNLKFCFDADAAGLTATKRAIQMYLGKDFTVRIINLTGAKDPDELIRQDPKAWERHIQEAPLFLDFYINKVFEQFSPSSVEDKKKVAAEVLPLLARLTDMLEQEHYIQLISERLATPGQVLRDVIKQHAARTQPGSTAPAPAAPAMPRSFGPGALEKLVLGGMVAFPEFRQKVLADATVTDFEHPEIQGLFEALKNPGVMPDHPLAKEGIFMVESSLEDQEGGKEAFLRELTKSFALLKLQSLKRQQHTLHAAILQAESSGDKTKTAQLNKQFAELVALRHSYEQQT